MRTLKERTLVWRIGLKPPIENAELVRKQMWDSHLFANEHVEVERERRAAQRAAISSYEDIQVLETRVAEATDKVIATTLHIKAARSQARSKSESKELQAALKAAKLEKKEAMQAWRERKAELRKDGDAQLLADEANEAASVSRKALRTKYSQRGQRMRHGTYSMVEDAAESARKTSLYWGIEPRDPKFHRWEGARIGAQIHGWDPSKPNTFLRIDEPDPRPAPEHDCLTCRKRNPDGNGWVCPKKIERTNGCQRCCPIIEDSKRASGFRVLRLRVGSDPKNNREPIWASWPMVEHRPLPKGAIITFAAVSLNMIGPRDEWSAELTVKFKDDSVLPTPPDSTIAVDIGWRVIGKEIRVACWRATDGTSGELRLSEEDVRELREADRLRSIRDTAFNEARDTFCTWLREHQMPEWMRRLTVKKDDKIPSQAQAIAYLAEWESEARLGRLARIWAKNRFEGDALAFGALEAWRYHDHHLWTWESSQRTGALRRRLDKYRCWGDEYSLKHGTLLLEDLDLRVFAKKKSVESQESENKTARRNRQMVALSEFRLAAINAFKRRGRVMRAPCRDTTRRCNICGVIEKFNAAAERTHTCVNGHHWDQDDNAASNLLWILKERPGDCWLEGTKKKARKDDNSRPGETRRSKANRMAAERKARLDKRKEKP